MPPPRLRPDTHQLYIAHLAGRLDAMEEGRVRLDPVTYRLWSRRLREALAGCPEPALAKGLATAHPSIAQALEIRHFDAHGLLRGPAARRTRRIAGELFGRLALRRR